MLPLLAEIPRAYGDLRASMARQIAADPGEPRLLFMAFLGCMIGFVAGLPSAFAQAAALPDEGALFAVLVARLFAAIFMAPLMLYGIAALVRLGARAAGGAGSHRAMRLALFWAILVASPVLVAVSVLGDVAASVPALATTLNLAGYGAFLWIFAAFLAQAEGYGRVAMPFAALLAVSGLLGALIVST